MPADTNLKRSVTEEQVRDVLTNTIDPFLRKHNFRILEIDKAVEAVMAAENGSPIIDVLFRHIVIGQSELDIYTHEKAVSGGDGYLLLELAEKNAPKLGLSY